MKSISTYISICNLEEDKIQRTIGRVISFRRQGGIAFGTIQDISGTIQFCFQKKEIGELIKTWSAEIQLGNFIDIEGKTGLSSTKQKTLFVSNFANIGKAETSFPSQWYGIENDDVRLRKRYIDCAINEKTRKIFLFRSKLIFFIRDYLTMRGFLEIETPVLSAQASGAQAKPFETHHNALNASMFLRIAPETYLKRAVAAGFTKVFELGKQFRNEGIDPSHLQEFTSLEWYIAGLDYFDNLEIFHQLLMEIIITFNLYSFDNENETHLSYQEKNFIFYKDKPKPIEYRKLFKDITGEDCDKLDAKSADNLFKQKVRPTIIQPTYVIDYPAHLSPMAKRKDDGKTSEQWQFIINGWEIVKCYSELTDAKLQRELLEEQLINKQAGDDETMGLEEDFLECMAHGMPDMSGVGVGIDRLICLLTNQKSLRDVVLFPTLLKKDK